LQSIVYDDTSFRDSDAGSIEAELWLTEIEFGAEYL
jgi:hypothetical protein